MYSLKERVVISALLHDVGKLCGRASGKKMKHSDEGAEYIKEKTSGEEDWQDIIDGIRFHHEEALGNAKLPQDSIAYLIYEADNISAGLDRRVSEQDSRVMWDRNAALLSIFNILDGKKDSKERGYKLKALKQDDDINLPVSKESLVINQQRYQYLLGNFETGLEQFIDDRMQINSLLRLLELSFYAIPSNTATSQQADISLFHHAKTTAMIASCLYDFFEEQEITDYKKHCLEQKAKLRMQQAYLLVGGDISGIQNFIYSVSSKGALKFLRGRSFYLEIFSEHIIDEILQVLELSRVNLIYSGGGHFYMLLPNTKKTEKVLREGREKINQWLLDNFGVDLYLEISLVPASADNLANKLTQEIKTTNELGDLYAALGKKISSGKLKRYNKDILKRIMVDELEKKEDYGNRECSACGKADSTLFGLDEADICKVCYGLFTLGDMIPRVHNKKIPTFLSVEEKESDIALPSLTKEKKFLYVDSLKEAETRLKKNQAKVYSLNNDSFGYNFANNLWIGSYNYLSPEEQGKLIDFSTLTEQSRGVKRLGMLKADVDNLGSTFKNAFINQNSQNPYQLVSLSRNTTLSHLLSMFFKHEINKIGEGRIENKFSLLEKENDGYKIVIIYSGGDDLLAVGAWDQVLEFAVNLNSTFKDYTMGKMTMSAGLGLFPAAFPVNQMAKITEQLEKEAKDAGKNSLVLFGTETAALANDKKDDSQKHVYSWEDFESKVYNDKFCKLYDWFDILGNDERKIPYSGTAFYRLMSYVSELNHLKDNKVNIARIAYIIARMEPEKKLLKKCASRYQEFANQFYQWVQDKAQLKELLTALMLIIYLNRKE